MLFNLYVCSWHVSVQLQYVRAISLPGQNVHSYGKKTNHMPTWKTNENETKKIIHKNLFIPQLYIMWIEVRIRVSPLVEDNRRRGAYVSALLGYRANAWIQSCGTRHGLMLAWCLRCVTHAPHFLPTGRLTSRFKHFKALSIRVKKNLPPDN